MRNTLILLVASLLVGCSENSTHLEHNDTTIVDYTIKQGKPLPVREWLCYDIDEDKICAPVTWGFVKQNSFFFMSDLSNIAPSSYFVIVKKDKISSGLDTKKYLKKLFTEFKQDSTGRLAKSQAIEVTYADKKVVYSEYYITMGKEPYIVYSTIFELDNDLYDISLKMITSKAKIYHEAYQNVIFNFYHNNSQVFTSKDKVVNAEIVDLTKL